MNTLLLKTNIRGILHEQGYRVHRNGRFELKATDRETWRRVHELAKVERLTAREAFIRSSIPLISKYLVDGQNLNVSKIKPKLIEVHPDTEEEIIFRWWNLAWWSLPYERAYGRQIRFIVWDQYHNAPIGLIGLQSPILSWSVRDDYLHISAKERDYWVNQSMNAQRIGALPPYNEVLGGKLVAMLMTTNKVRQTFEKKYDNKRTIMKHRKLPARLLFITTTGAYGKSSVYQRLKYKTEFIAKYIGVSQGTGTFHIPNHIYEELLSYLKKKGLDVKRGYGNGPSRKMRLIDQALQLLGFANGVTHGVKRAVYLFPFVRNLEGVIIRNERPKWVKRSIKEMNSFWLTRWALPRAERDDSYKKFSAKEFIDELLYNLELYKKN